MSFDYARTRATSDRLISKFGQAAILRRPTTSGTAYNPTPGDPEDHTVTIVALDYDRREIDGTRILATDRKVLLAVGSLAIEPATSDKVVIGGIEHSIIDVQPLNPGGTTILHQLQVRR